MGDPDGRATDDLVDLYRRLAAGSVGLIVSSYLSVSRDGRQSVSQLGVYDDEQIAGLKRIAEVVHQEGGTIVGQIVHCGGQAKRKVSGTDPVAPSAVESPGYPEVPLALSEGEVERIIQDFAKAAVRVKQAGFDGVQLHGAHGYLMAQFLSPVRNLRTDGYGGSIEARARFACEVFEAIRKVVGNDFPIMIKLNGHDFLEGSTTETDSCFLAQKLEELGVAAIEVSGGTPGSGKLGPVRIEIAESSDEAYFLSQARAIRKAAPNTPLMVVGGVRSLERMNEILAAGEAEFFAMCRPFIREPDLVRRWEGGATRRADCISCSGCFRTAVKGQGLGCVRV